MMIDQVITLHFHKCSSNDQYSSIHLSLIFNFHKALYQEEFLNHTKYMAYMCQQGVMMLKSNGSNSYGNIGKKKF